MQAPGDRAAGCRLHRSACARRVHLPWRGERAPAIAQLLPKDRRGAARVRTHPAAGRGFAQCTFASLYTYMDLH